MKSNVNLDLKTLVKKLRVALLKFQRYAVIVFIVILVGLYGYLVLQISSSATKEPTQAQVMEELGTVKRLKIDQDSINKIQKLVYMMKTRD